MEMSALAGLGGTDGHLGQLTVRSDQPRQALPLKASAEAQHIGKPVHPFAVVVHHIGGEEDKTRDNDHEGSHASK
jgi:hypothetical protein